MCCGGTVPGGLEAYALHQPAPGLSMRQRRAGRAGSEDIGGQLRSPDLRHRPGCRICRRIVRIVRIVRIAVAIEQ